MIDPELWALFVNTALVNNFVLAWFLGICPFLGVSGRLDSAGRMGLAVTFVMVIASLCAWGIHRILTVLDARYLELIAFIVVIASTVQLVEMVVRRTSPALFRALGLFLPLITTNCAILAVALFQTNRGYGLLQGLVFALGAGAGFALALVLMAGIRDKLRLGAVPDLAQGVAITLVLAGILSLAFMGFAGMGVEV